MKKFIPRSLRLQDWLEFLSLLSSAILVFLVLILFYELITDSLKAFITIGFVFLVNTVWNPSKGIFGALPFIYGTLYTSTLAILIAFPISIGIAVVLTEILPKNLSEVFSTIVELIAAIPSVVIGLWGIFYLAPFIRDVLAPALLNFSFIPLFQGRTFGYSYLTATLVLIFMITPISTSVYNEAFKYVPRDLKEAMYALGATRYEVIRKVVLPYTKSSLVAGLILAYGRAIGETLAVTMVIGNKPNITLSLLAPGYTIASVIANEFLEATNTLYISSLLALGLILLAISLLINYFGGVVLRRLER
ncbi:MAG: phosphate ABC transporter permease subunit PstC [Candidatus Njordarchaeia archaeon]